jgi:hypothetical protein
MRREQHVNVIVLGNSLCGREPSLLEHVLCFASLRTMSSSIVARKIIFFSVGGSDRYARRQRVLTDESDGRSRPE